MYRGGLPSYRIPNPTHQAAQYQEYPFYSWTIDSLGSFRQIAGSDPKWVIQHKLISRYFRKDRNDH